MRLFHQYQKFFAPHAGDRTKLVAMATQYFGDLDQYPVTCGMSEPVVDDFEFIQINRDDCAKATACLCGLCYGIIKSAPV